MKLNIGDKAPDFRLKNQAGEDVELKDHAGKWIVLYFYPKDNTSGCTLEAKDFTCLKNEFSSLNAVIIGVSKDSVKSHQNFISKQDLDLVLLSDPDHKTLEDYEAWRTKKMYGREFLGIVRSTFLIDPEGKIAFIWDKVKARDHAEKVLTKLKEFQ